MLMINCCPLCYNLWVKEIEQQLKRDLYKIIATRAECFALYDYFRDRYPKLSYIAELTLHRVTLDAQKSGLTEQEIRVVQEIGGDRGEAQAANLQFEQDFLLELDRLESQLAEGLKAIFPDFPRTDTSA